MHRPTAVEIVGRSSNIDCCDQGLLDLLHQASPGTGLLQEPGPAMFHALLCVLSRHACCVQLVLHAQATGASQLREHATDQGGHPGRCDCRLLRHAGVRGWAS